MENVIDIIYDYSKQSKLLDKNTILLICQILIEKYSIDTINNIHIGNTKQHSCLGVYKNKEICICLPRIYAFVKNKNFDNNYEDNLHHYLKCNMQILQIILHELEHAIQRMKIKTNNSDIETYLLKLEYDYQVEIWRGYLDSISNYIKHKKKLKHYKLLDLISFEERIAQINSYDKSCQIIEPIKNENNKLYHLYEDYYLTSKIYTYGSPDKYLAPTVLFFGCIDKLEELNKINRSNMSYEDRLYYGFELTNEEIERTRQLLWKHN